eukprot:9295082-Alexandrium_andersonii.AAC.2
MVANSARVQPCSSRMWRLAAPCHFRVCVPPQARKPAVGTGNCSAASWCPQSLHRHKGRRGA